MRISQEIAFRNHRRYTRAAFCIALIGMLLLTGCSEPTPLVPTATATVPTATSQPATTTAVIPPTALPTDTPAPSPTEKNSPTATNPPMATPRPPLPSPTRIAPTRTPTAAPTTTPESWPYFRDLVVSPTEARTLYAAIGDRAYTSDDRGITWDPLHSSGINQDSRIFSVALDYRNPSVMYVTTSSGIYQSVDGSPWTFVHPLQATTLAVDLIEPDVLWAGVSWTTEYGAVILKSTDAGRTWGKADLGIRAYLGCGVTHIAIDPADPNILYANLRYGGRFGWPNGWLYRGGRSGTWEQLELWEPSADSQFSDDACMANGLAFDPTLRRLYVGCDAYYYNNNRLLLLASNNAHEADSSLVRWEQMAPFGVLQQPYALGVVRPLAVDARQPKSLYAIVVGYGASGTPYRIMVSRDDATTWQDMEADTSTWR